MTKMKMKLFKTVLIFAIPLALLFAACTVGLGSAVDTGAPTVEVSYPPKNSVIRQSFVVSGSCADDLAVSYVDVTVTNSSTREVYGPYRATLNRDKSQWSVQLNRNNNQDYSTYEAYKQWEFPDGNYIVTAKSVDGKNNPSPEASIPVSIDNTAPVLLVSKPLAYGTETASVYGRTLNIIGDISEEHETSKLVLYYKEANSAGNLDAETETKTLEISGFGTMSSDNPLVIAKLDATSQQTQTAALDQNYRIIYGSQTIDLNSAEKKNYYCGFMLEDNAKTYQNPGDSGVTGGNQSTEYYILSDNFNDELFSEEKYSLNARNLMLLLSGKSNYSSSEIETITSKLEEAGNSAKSTDITAAASSKFSIDPKNNPVWSISNYSEVSGQFNTYEKGASIPFVLQTGGDGKEIVESSISIKLYDLGPQFVQITDSTPYVTLINAGNPGEYSDGALKTKLDNKFETNQSFFHINHYYEFVVDGEDIDHNRLAGKDGLRYGFKLYSSFAPPSIAFITGENGFEENQYKQGKSVDDNGIIIYGQITTADQTIEIEDTSKISVSGITVTKLSDGSPVPTNTEDAYIKYATPVISNLHCESEGNSTEGKTYTFKAKITKQSGAHLIPAEPGAYKYKVGFVAEDSYNAINAPVEFEFKLDSKAPQLTDEPVITPIARKDDKDCVNGTITISGNLTDEGSGAEKLYYQIGTASPVPAIPNTTTTSLGYHWSFDIDTTAADFNNDTDITLKIFAKDAVLNDGGSETNNPSDFPKYFVTKQIRVDQSTDKPVITPTNEATIFTKTNNRLNFTVTDDDGLKEIKYRTKKTYPEAGDWSDQTTISATTLNKTTSYSLNISLPDEEGEYTVEVTAEDIKGLSTGHDTKEFTNIEKDYGAPDFKITSSYTADTWLNALTAGAVTISGSVKDGSGEILKIERKIDNGEFAVLASSGANPDITITGLIVSGANWIDSSIPALENGQHTIKYRATDKYSQTTEEKSVTFSVDNNPPTIGNDVTFGETATADGWYNKSFGDFTVTVADDGGSGIKAVYYQKAGMSETNTWAGMSENADHTSWSANIAFSDSEAKTLYFKAEDNAGNETTTPVSKTYQIDTTIPELTLTGLSGEVYVNKKSDKNFTASFKDFNGSGVKSLKIEIIKQTETGTQTVYTKPEELTETEIAASKTTAGGQKTISIPKASLAEGQLKVTAFDLAGNSIQKSVCNFIVDTAAPVIQTPEITKVYKEADKKYFVNNVSAAAFTISGSIVDDKFAGATLTITEQGVSSGAHSITKNITSSSWSFDDIDLSSWTSGTSAKCVITASDEAGNSTADLNAAGQNSNYEFDIFFDTALPGIESQEVSAGYKFRNVEADVKKDNKIFIGTGRYSEHTFGNLNAIKITVYPTDAGSGISKLEYRLSETDQSSNFDSDSVTWSSSGVFKLDRSENPIKAETTISGFKSTSVENPNYLLLRPVDNCGNKGNIKVLKIHVDQTAPTVVATATKQLTNGTKIIELEGSVYDEDAGLKALNIKINNGSVAVLSLDSDASTTNSDGYIEVSNDTYGSFSYKGYAPSDPKNVPGTYFTTTPLPETYSLSEAPSYIKWKLKLKTNNLNDGDIIQLEAVDWADNIAPNPAKLAVIEKDIDPPVVEIKAPAPGTAANPKRINGKNTIKGISSDPGSSPETLELYYSSAATMPVNISGYVKLSEISTVGDNAVNVSQLYKFEFADVNFYDTRFISASEEVKDIWLLVIATDKAGNKSEDLEAITSAVKYRIDRNTDRPELTITNDDANLDGMSSSNSKLLKDEQIYINVYDDDGLTASNAQESDLQVWYKTSKDNLGYRQITPLNSGSGNFTLSADGKQTLEFKIVDIFGNVYESAATNSWERIKLYDSQNPKHEFIDDPKLYITLDLASPEVSVEGMKRNSEADWSSAADFERDVKVVGGATKKLVFKVKATDIGSGIKENGVTVEAKLNTTTITGTSVTAIAGETDLYQVEIPCTAAGEGILGIEIKAEDNAGRTSIIEKQYDFDNNKPEISIEAPEEDTEQFGTITVQGFTSERVKLSYAVSPMKLFRTLADGSQELISPDEYTDSTPFSFIKEGTTSVTLPTKDKSNNDIAPSEALKDLCSFKQYSANTTDTLTTFYIYFDGQTITGNNHTEQLNTWLKNIGITTTTDLNSTDNTTCFDDIVTLYLYLKAEDTAGNITIRPFTLPVDPQGNRPKLEFSYPTGNGLTLGGTINLIGSVTGNSDSYAVYMKVEKKNTAGEWNYVNLHDKGYTTVTDDEYTAILNVDGTTWSQRFNESDEFNPTSEDTDGLSHLRVSIFAEDADGIPSSIRTRSFVIDNKMPVIEQELTLVQFNTGFNANTAFTVDSTSGDITYASGALKASREYKDNMSVAGKWYLVGKVTDESGLAIINTDGTKDSDNHTNLVGSGLAADGSIVKAFNTSSETGCSSYVFCLAVGSDADNAVGVSNLDFYAKDGGDAASGKGKSKEVQFTVKYDNMKPVVTSLGDDIDILNENGFYTFGSDAYENGISSGSQTVNQTGVERVAFYFTRALTNGTPSIFDPMIRSGRTGNLQAYESLAHEDGLYWISADIKANGVNQATITLQNNKPVNVHKGGLAKVNGTIYRIKNITSEVAGTTDYKKIELSGNPGNATTVKFAIANVIDNTIPEELSRNNVETEKVENYGYGYPKGIYDDGDLMPEKFKTVGTKTTWEATINSKNISDGPVVLHYVVFDKAGNFKETTSTAMVQNNSPRIAGALIGTDEDGDGEVNNTDEYSEFISYSNIFENGYSGGIKATDVTIPKNSTDAAPVRALVMKRKTVIKPEVVGGNGKIGYTWSVSARNTDNNGWEDAYYNSGSTPVDLGTGTGDDEDETSRMEYLTGVEGIVLTEADILGKNIADGENQKFTFTLWDSTTGLTYGTNTQKAKLNVIMDVVVRDGVAAKNKIIPFYWNSAESNSLKENSSAKGHIELPQDYNTASPDGIPKISGAIKLEGIAQDNSLLKSLSVNFNNGSDNTYEIATYSAGTWTKNSGTGWSTEIRKATYGELLNAGYIDALPEDEEGNPYDETEDVPYSSQAYGHIVHWTMNIDTETMLKNNSTDKLFAPKAGIVITVSALDKGTPAYSNGTITGYTSKPFANNGVAGTVAQTGGNNAEGPHTCKYTVDLVPYIRGIKTALSKKSKKDDTSEYDRTARGHYPVASTETIYLYGFNLAGGTLYDKAYVNDTTTANHKAALGAADTTKYAGKTVYAVTDISAFTSGPVYVKVGNVQSLNNSNNNNSQGAYGADIPDVDTYGDDDTYTTFYNFYNRMPNEQNNYTLTDDVELDVWNINSEAALPTHGGRIDEPVMKINPRTNNVGFAFLDGPKDFSRPGNMNTSYKTADRYNSQHDARTTAALAYDWDGNSYSLNGGGNEGDPINFERLSAGKGTKTNVYIEYVCQNKKRDGSGAYMDLRYKIRSPNIVTSKNGTDGTNIYMVYYDSYNDEIRYKYGTAVNNGLLVAGSKDYTSENSQVIATDASTNMPTDTDKQYIGTPLGGAGEYVDIAVIPKGTTVNGTQLADDVVVVVWYDSEEKTLKYSYNTNPKDYSWKNNTNATAYHGLNRTNWEDATPIFSGAGEFCQVKVDGNGGVHIAAFDPVSGDLRYAYLSTYKSTSSITTYLVDTAGNVGSHMRMDVALKDGNPVPYISYYGSNMPKLAVLKSETAGAGTINDMFTGNWEVTYIPTSSEIEDMDYKKLMTNVDNRINVGVWKTTAGVIRDSKRIDNQTGAESIETPTASAGSGAFWGNGTENPVVAYSVLKDTANSRIEAAQMQ